MCPRPRDRVNRDLPPNLYPHPSGYRYINPLTKKEYYFGRDKQQAVNDAKTCNANLMPTNCNVDKVLGTGHRINECIELFRTEDIPSKHWKLATKREAEAKLRRIEDDLGLVKVETYGVKEWAEYLRQVTNSPGVRKQYRSLLCAVLANAVSEGWIPTNPILQTKKISKPERVRQRLSYAEFKALREIAPPWLQNAMDLSLHTLQRRADVAWMKFEDIKDGALYVVPRKTESTSFVRIKMTIQGELEEITSRCRDAVLSPFLVHRLPEKARPSNMRADEREHHTQILPEQISRAFQRLVCKSKLFEGIENPPTFHEIRSLGGHLYRQKGWSLKKIEQLMGHASEDMTKLYLEGHDAPWIEIGAGLQSGDLR